MAEAQARRRNATASTGVPGWVWFFAGLSTGVFASFLYVLWQDIPVDPEVEVLANEPATDGAGDVQEMQWDFYDIFPKSEVPVVEEYAADGTKSRVPEDSAWLLQAGSFRGEDDADSLRAELILLGMEAFVRKIDNDGDVWHRVMVGPLDSEVELSRHRRKLAEANIPSIAMRIPKG